MKYERKDFSASKKKMKQPNLQSVTINLISWTIALLVSLNCCDGGQINPLTTLECHLREYTYAISKDMVSETGEYMPCSDKVTVYSCWGRCDSYEFGDWKVPYKISYHPVCTYTSRRSRKVRLRHCHPNHPEPIHEVFDAVACSCKLCNPDFTSCENLNG